MPRGFGIDFGTTNSVVALHNEAGQTRALIDKSTDRFTHPSVVWYRGAETIVGAKARASINTYAQESGNLFVKSVKRSLGKDRTFDRFGHAVPAWQVATDIFRHLKASALKDHGETINEAVVTIPVRFDGLARRDLRRAADAAGIHVKTFIHEPFAAVVGYYATRDQGLFKLGESTILVFDWGGGTLDITAVRIKDGSVWELATEGLNDIAGDLFDQKLQSHAVSMFFDRYRLGPTHADIFPGTFDRLSLEAERVKIKLSTATDDTINVACFYSTDGHIYDLKEPVSCEKFDGLIEKSLDQAMATLQAVLDSANLNTADISAVLLIGGTSRIPRLQKMMMDTFGARIVLVERADTIIAEGAAIVSAKGWRPYLAKAITVQLSDRSYESVFPSQTILLPKLPPATLRFFCTDNRGGRARLILCEQQRDDDPSSSQHKLVLSVPVAEGTPQRCHSERVEAQFEVDENLVLTVGAKAVTQERGVKAEFYDLHFGLKGE